MSDTRRISELPQGTPLNNDIIPYVDLTTSTTKKAFKSALKGDQGDTGATGATGATGSQGPLGVQGPQGVQGIQGNDGADGTSFQIKGAVDVVGDLPSEGNTDGDGYFVGVDKNLYYWSTDEWIDYGPLVGLQGPQGIQGVQGPQGIQGEAGADGAAGATGATGATGAKGDKGDKGDTGTSFIWEDAYSAETIYSVNDVVSYNGSSYICILESTANLPTNTT